MTKQDWQFVILVSFLALVLGAFLEIVQASDVYRVPVTIQEEQSWDGRGMRFFHLQLGDGYRITVTMDRDAPFAQALSERAGQKVILSLEPRELAR